MENGVIFLSSDSTDLDCYKIHFSEKKQRLNLTFIQSFKEIPYYFFTHGEDKDRLLVDGKVF